MKLYTTVHRMLHIVLLGLTLQFFLTSCSSDDSVTISCTEGTICNDNDVNTSGDKFDVDCNCVGIQNTGLNLGSDIPIDIAGRVFNESGQPLSGVAVVVGSDAVVTDENGVFFLSDASVKEKLGYVKAIYSGYFTGSRTFVPTEGRNIVNIRLLARNAAGSFNAVSGGTVEKEGVSIVFPGGSFIKDGSPYMGTVNVDMNYIDPESANFNDEMPGNLLGVQDGNGRVLASFGMVAVELTDNSGEEILLDPNTTAEVRFPVPASLQASAPAEIDLWYFDENSGYWVSEGKAILDGEEYVASVSHFSFWNCDIPTNYIYLNGQVTLDGQGVQGAYVVITSTNYGYGTDYTDAGGYFGGIIPAGENLTITVYVECFGALQNVYSAEIGPYSNDVTLDPIEIEDGAMITGSVVGCDSNILYDAYVFSGDQVYFMGDGSFWFVTCQAEETIYPYNSSGQAGTPVTVDVSGDDVDVGALQVCHDGPCYDGIQNGNETDIDCGGECTPCTLTEGNTFRVVEKDYWRIFEDRSDLDDFWPETMQIVEVSQGLFKQLEWAGLFDGNELYFNVGLDNSITYPIIGPTGEPQTLNDQPLTTCDRNPDDLPNVFCNLPTTNTVTFEDGVTTLYMAFGYYTAGSGPRNFIRC